MMNFYACVLLALALPTASSDQGALQPYQPPVAVTDWPKDKLVKFMRELTDFVYENHVVRDESRKTYGMTYEFYKDGKWIQVFGLDSMHDGSWFMSAMATAHRIDPGGGYLERVQKYQVPFYVNMLNNSDRIFPDMQPTDEDKHPFDQPVKGWAPRGWDDGSGYDKNTGELFQDGYFTSSNHLMQDLSDALLNVWMTTQDPAVAQAAMNIHNYKRKYFGSIPVIDFAAGMTNQRPELYERLNLPVFSPSDMRPYYTGMYQQKGHGLPAYDDDLAWRYRQATAEYMLKGSFPEEFSLHAAAKVYGYQTAMEMFFDDRPYPYGMYFFDIQQPPVFVEGRGKLDGYSSNAKKILGARGIQISWSGAAVLPMLARQPELWEQHYRSEHGDEPLIRVVDDPPVTDGLRDSIYSKSQSLESEGVKLTFLSDPKNLHVFIESSQPEVSIKIRHTEPVAGEARVGRFTVNSNGDIKAINDKDEALIHAISSKTGKPWTAEIRIPYTIVPGQVQWINGVEHGRYTVMINDAQEQVFYMLSEPERIVRRLEAMTLGTIETWYKIWQELGCIPSGYRGPNLRVDSWELSDLGNYAHLIKAIALWLMYQEGTSEWELIRQQLPSQPRVASLLPDGVLEMQGLK